jgi:hypothetical protein
MAARQSETVNPSLQGKTIGRRAILAGLATASIAGTATAAEHDDTEAVLAAWREWRPLQCEDAALTPQIQAAYKALPNWVKVPQIQVLDTWCWDDKAIDDVCDRAPTWMNPAIPDLRVAAKRELQDLWRRGEEYSQRCGYTDLEKRSDAIMERQVALVKRIENSNSNHPIVIAAKIDMALSEASSDDLFGDCPWVPISAILRALMPHLPADMAAALAPAAEERGSIGELFGLSVEA